jgi:hypothetical protein
MSSVRRDVLPTAPPHDRDVDHLRAARIGRAAIALAALLAAGPAFAGQSILPRLAEVDDAVKNVAPVFECNEPGNKDTCQQIRHTTNVKGEGFTAFDGGGGRHAECFWPTPNYGICHMHNQSGDFAAAALSINGHVAFVRSDDPRCSEWGSYDTPEYLACEAAQAAGLEKAK